MVRWNALRRHFSVRAPAARLLTTASTEPWFNLALEQWIFEESDPEKQTLFLWQNAPTVVIGRHQNPWLEMDVAAMEAGDVYLARRHSGGGAVYQDLGNLNFTFLSPRTDYDVSRNNGIITRALKDAYGLETEATGRNDIVMSSDGAKFSGAAFRLEADRAFHHGTLMMHVEMSRLGKLLTPNKLKLQAKGVKSVAARVTNLRDRCPEVEVEGLKDALSRSFLRAYGEQGGDASQMQVLTPGEGILADRAKFDEFYAKLRDWDFRFGRTSAFTHDFETRFDWGLFKVHLDVQQGRIVDCQIFSDCLSVNLVNRVTEALCGTEGDRVRYTSDDLRVALAQARHVLAGEGEQLPTAFDDWLLACIRE